ncbi:hypothetical protein GW796_06995 [archaeon]|nr:hypothetical protein [archaeon]
MTPIVKTKEDIDKKIQMEFEHLVYFEFKNKKDAMKEAKEIIESQYKAVINKLIEEGKY